MTMRVASNLPARLLVVWFGLATVGCTAEQAVNRERHRLFENATSSRGKLDDALKSRIIRHRFVNIDSQVLAPTPKPSKNLNAVPRILILNLFDDAVYPVVFDRLEVRSNTSFTWFGHIEGVENSQVTLVNENGIVVGNIRLNGSLYEVRYAGEGTHVIYQIDPSKFPKESEPLLPGTRN